MISLGYDAAGRAHRVTSPDGVHTVSYDPTTGQVTGLSAPGGVGQTFTYNGALPATTTWTGPVVRGSVEAWYDEVLRPSGLMVGGRPLGSIFYSRDGLPTNIGALILDYRPDNALLESVRGGRALTTFAYDSLGQVLLSATVNATNDDTLFRQGFTYDRLGRLIGLAERIKADTVTYAYGYDAAGRLAEVRAGGVVTATYTYDLNGNRTRVVTPSQTIVASYDAQDRLLSAGSATYAHAATGERTLKIVGTDTTRTRYDSYGNLRDVYLPNGTHVQYAVDAQQRRTARLVNGVVTNRWLYQSQLAIAAEVDSAGTPIRTFTYGLHGNVPTLMTLANGREYRLVTDHLGSVRLVIDVTADTVVQRLEYDAYGRVVVDTRPGFQPFGYAGGLYDPLTGLVRFGARDYDAESGRWTARDPIGFAGGTPNLYEYAGARPSDSVDPSGRCVPLCVSALVGGALGAYQGFREGGAAGAGTGFVVGAVTGLIPGFSAVRLLGARSVLGSLGFLSEAATGGFLANLAVQLAQNCGDVSWSDALIAAGSTTVGAVIGARLPLASGYRNMLLLRNRDRLMAGSATVAQFVLEQLGNLAGRGTTQALPTASYR